MVAMHWDRICKVPGVEVGKQRLEELRTEFFSDLEQPGGSFMPGNHNVKSNIENFFSQKCEGSPRTNIYLSIERELNENNMFLPFTGAGKIVIEAMDLRIKEIENGLDCLQQAAAATPDPVKRQDVETEIQKMKYQLYGFNEKQTQIKKLLPPPSPSPPPREDHSKHQAASMTGFRTNDEIAEYIRQCQCHQQSLFDKRSDRSTPQYHAGDIQQPWPPKNLNDQEGIEIETLLQSYNQFMGDAQSSMRKLRSLEEDMTLEMFAEVFKYCNSIKGGVEHGIRNSS